MKIDNKDKWIDQLQKKLDGYSEDVPQEVWNSLEKELSSKAVPL